MSIMKTIAVMMVFVSSVSWAAMCPITVENDVLITPESEIKVETPKDKLRIEHDGRVFVNGNELTLTEAQQQAVKEYQQQVANYVPAIMDFTDQGIEAANRIVEDIEHSFNADDSFNAVKHKIDEYGDIAKQKFYLGKDMLLQQDLFNEVENSWKTDFEVMIRSLDKELFAGVFNSLSDRMQQGEFNFSELQQQFTDVQSSIKARIEQHRTEMKKEAEKLCDSAKEFAEEEQELHQLVPELQPYPIFTI